MTVVWAVLLIVAVILFWMFNLVGLPGNWLILAASVAYSTFVDQNLTVAIGWVVVAMLFGLVILGEITEFVAGAYGAARAGGSRRGAVLALIGSLVGAVVGMVVSLPIPIPVVAPVLGALLLASVGALAGAMLGEQWAGKDLDQSWQVGQSAFWGRLLGTVGKMMVGCVMVALIAAALVF